jgi:hypothetical protein
MTPAAAAAANHDDPIGHRSLRVGDGGHVSCKGGAGPWAQLTITPLQGSSCRVHCEKNGLTLGKSMNILSRAMKGVERCLRSRNVLLLDGDDGNRISVQDLTNNCATFCPSTQPSTARAV